MSGTDKILDAAYAAFETEAESLRATAGVLDRAEFEKAVSVLASAERIAASGCGHSGIACRHFAHLCCCIERPARFLSPSEAVHGGLGYICGGVPRRRDRRARADSKDLSRKGGNGHSCHRKAGIDAR